MRKLLTVMGALALILVGFTAGSRANDRDETIMTVQVSSADHRSAVAEREIPLDYFVVGRADLNGHDGLVAVIGSASHGETDENQCKGAHYRQQLPHDLLP